MKNSPGWSEPRRRNSNRSDWLVSYPHEALPQSAIETDDAVQMRDVFRWIKEEFHRVVVDNSTGTTVDFRLAKKPPPTGLACKILETWASKPLDKRDGLYEKIQKYLSSFKVTETEPEYEDEAFLHLLK